MRQCAQVFFVEIEDVKRDEDALTTPEKQISQDGPGAFSDAFTIGTQDAVLADQSRPHLSVRINVLVKEAPQLDVACGDHSMPYRL